MDTDTHHPECEAWMRDWRERAHDAEAENERLHAENERLQAALRHFAGPTHGGHWRCLMCDQVITAGFPHRDDCPDAPTR